MQSSPGSLSPQAQSVVSLAIVALIALGASLLLAIAALPKARIVTPSVQHGAVLTPERRAFPMPPSSTPVSPAPATAAERPLALKMPGSGTTLAPLLLPWAIGVDALAIVGLGIALLVRRRART